ncbi:hypothetical protein CC78DRAFT_549639 [Lojkania enalia]|uniref:Uncharacterized protein n=1 Tax=Lojkania enalia TaxID=147567 RepID=A0A9P4JWH5_9PLEO|nr:hypothetical protein CC78DRAFT_549639 [Didymosphaeria enalia]
MPSSRLRPTVSSSPTLWEPRSILNIDEDSRCVGYAPSRGRKCLMPLAQSSLYKVESLLNMLAAKQPDATCPDLQDTLRQLAGFTLCVRFHQGQNSTIVQKWTDRISEAFPRGVVQTTILHQHRDLESTSSRRPNTDSNIRQIASISTATESVPAEVESLRAIIRDAQRQLAELGYPIIVNDVLQSSLMPRQQTPSTSRPSRLLSRVSTSNISSLNLSPSSTSSSSTTSSSTTSTQPSSTHPATSPNQNTTATSRTYQRVPSRLPTTIVSVSRCARTHVPRRPLTEECSICYEDGFLSTQPISDLTSDELIELYWDEDVGHLRLQSQW